MRTEVVCRTCDDEGVILVETTIAVASHSPHCGPDACSYDCPIPVPERLVEEERCPDCGGQT